MNSDNFHANPELSRLDDDIRIVSRFQAVRICRAALSILLIALELFLAYRGSYSSSALNILLFANLTPWLLEELLLARQEAKKDANSTPDIRTRSEAPAAQPAAMPYLRKHYHYSRLRFTAETVSYFMTCLLLLLWQGRGSKAGDTADWLRNAPVFLLSIIVLLRLAAPYYLAWRIRHRLLDGKMK
ncbi:MAG: hypothetical protein K2N94_17040 [Lachnospiraceae bacterium]|nr:hypothetical protein [Lachnospiraceae bacterium]